MKKRKVKITNTGYLPDSPDRFNDMNIIPSNRITMKDVKFPILGTDDLGNQQMMMPGGEYEFPGKYVTEVPMGNYQNGGIYMRDYEFKDGGLVKYQKKGQVSFDEYMMEGLRPSRAYSESTFVEPAAVREAKKDDVKGVTPKQKVKAAATKKKIAEEEKKEQIKQQLLDQGEIKPATDGTERLKNQFIYAMDQPLDAVGSLMQRGYVPQGNLSGNYPTSSPMSDVIGAFNPASVLMDVGRVGRDLGEKETYSSWGGAGELGLNAAGFLPFGSIAQKGLKSLPAQSSRNLADLKKLQEFAGQYGYELPTNIERIAQSDELTDRTVRGLMDRHNTFVRGVSTNWDELQKALVREHGQEKADEVWKSITDNFEKNGVDYINNPQAAAEYMATHIPLSTGYGRASLDNAYLSSGLEGLYTSNSMRTAEGYTYGKGYMVKAKRPTNFSSTNRQDWITDNSPEYYDEYLPKEERGFPIDLTRKDFERNLELGVEMSDSKREKLTKYYDELPDLKREVRRQYGVADEELVPDEVLDNFLEDFEKAKRKKMDELFPPVTYDKKLLRAERSNQATDAFDFLIKKEGDAKSLSSWLKTQPYQEKMKEARELGESLGKYTWEEQQPIRAEIKRLERDTNELYNQSVQDYMKTHHSDYDPVNKYAHYIHLGKPGEKVLQPIKSWQVTPEKWENRSRGHQNLYTKGLSAMEKGGGIYLGKYEFKDGGLVKAEEGLETNFRRSNVDKSKVSSLQKELRNAGYDLGKSGKSKDGVDGVWGPKTEKAYRDYIAKQSRQTVESDSSAMSPFAEEDSVDFTQQIAESDSTKHNKALPNSLPQQAQQKNIQVENVPVYEQSRLAEESIAPMSEEYLWDTKEYATVPQDTLNPEKFYYQGRISELDLGDGRTAPIRETVPSFPIMASASDVPYNPVEEETQALTTGAVPKQSYDVQKNAPNLYREDGSACIVNGKVEDRCAAGYQLGLDMNFGDKINRRDLGMSGDSWEVGQNIIDKGGSRVYGLTNDLDISPTDYDNKGVKNLLDTEKKKRKVDSKKITNDAQVGDVVEMWYKDSSSQDEALSNSKGKTLTTHSGLVSEKDGVKYVTHNIHGTWHTDKLEDVVNGKRKYMASGIVRPNYKVDEDALGVKVSDKPRYFKSDDEERGLVHEGNTWSQKATEKGTVVPAKSTEANNFVQGLSYYAPQVQQDFGLSDNETEELMKMAFGVYGKESGFSYGSEYTKKRDKRKLLKLYKDIAPDWMGGDELSSGPTQIKLNTNFNTDAEKALLTKYGIDDKNIWDERNSAAATMLLMARNYERFKQVFGTGFDNTDPITMRNVLALAHNKGIDAVLKNEFTDVSSAEKRNLAERVYDVATTDTTWKESGLKGTKRRDFGALKKGLADYSNLHKQKGSYANLVQDYTTSLDVDYGKVKSNYWNTETVPSQESQYYDVTDWAKPSFIYDQKIEPMINEASEQIDAGQEYVKQGIDATDRKIEKGLKALEKKTRSGVNAVKKKVRMQEGGIYMGTFEFKDGGLVKAQKGLNKRMVRQYPGMKSVYGDRGENLNVIKDKNFIPSEYGYGDIEFIYPGSGLVTYNDEYAYQSPTPDKYTAVYNPKGANKHDVFLDMMHGMRHDPDYMELLNEFSQATRNARGADMDYFFDQDAQQDPNFVIDGREQWDDNYIDGMVRAHMYKKASQQKRLPFVNPFGSKPHGTEDYEMELEPNSPEMYQAADQIYNYIKGDKNRSLKKVKIKSLPRNTQ